MSERLIRCPNCAHPNAYLTVPEGEEHGPELFVTFRFQDGKAEPVLWDPVGKRYIEDPEEQLTCSRCGRPEILENWLYAAREPILFFDWWNNMCDCGGEFWGEEISDEGLVFVCDRCGARRPHEFPQ